MKQTNALLLLTFLATISWSFIRPNKTPNANPDPPNGAISAEYIEPDSTFVIESASSGMMEVELGTMAQQKATNQRVKDFGAMMVKDHSAANEELKTLASQKNFTIPDAMLAKHKRHVDHLSSLSGAAFDRAYINAMVKAHKDDIDEFEDASKKTKDADLRAWAAKQLPILTMHRDSAQSIRKVL